MLPIANEGRGAPRGLWRHLKRGGLRLAASAILAITCGAGAARATTIDLGYVSYDVTTPGSFSQFDILNETGANQAALGEPSFPVTTTETFSNLSLTVKFSDGSTQSFGPSSKYFSLSLDGLSFDGSPLAIGGANPQPISAVLTGSFSTTGVTLASGKKVTLTGSTFTADITDTAGDLGDGDFAYITANYSSGVPVPEPGSLVLLLTGLGGLLALSGRSRWRQAALRKLGVPAGALAVMVGLGATAAWAGTAPIGLNIAASPSSGTAGLTYVNLTAYNLPSDTIVPPSLKVTLAPTCAAGASGPVSGEIDTVAYSIKPLPGSTNSKRIQFLIPSATPQGTFLVSITGTSVGGAKFASTGCSILAVSHTVPKKEICLPTSSLAVSLGSTVTAYVPNGAWSRGATGIQVVQLEGAAGASAIATPNLVNSCSTNSASGETICTANNTDVYVLNGTSLTTTLTSGATGSTSYSGGSCQNCGVAINALTNTAYIAEGSSVSGSGSQLQVLNLSNNTFVTPFQTTYELSEDISVDPGRGYVLSPSYGESFEDPRYNLYQVSATGLVLQELTNPVYTPGVDFPDSAGEDCTTGIALSSLEDQSEIFLSDLTQISFPTTTTWTAPEQKVALTGLSFAAGTTGISMAPGSTHQGIVSGEFGGNTFAAILLPATSGSGTPGLVDFAGATLPTTPDGNSFSAGFDPHTVTAYTSPNTGLSYGVIADWALGSPSFLAVIDLKAVLAAPRLPGSNTVDPSYDLIAHHVVRYVATH